MSILLITNAYCSTTSCYVCVANITATIVAPIHVCALSIGTTFMCSSCTFIYVSTTFTISCVTWNIESKQHLFLIADLYICTCYRPQGSCGKVKFLHPLAGRPPGQTPLGRHPSGRQIPTPPLHGDGHCSGRYASYWNAFLLLFHLGHVKIMFQRTRTVIFKSF